MPTYTYRCPEGHHTEGLFKMSDHPEHIQCDCGKRARRVFEPPAAICFRGPGFYSTDVTGRIGRKRRPNPGDDLHKEFDTPAARIADSI